MYIYSKKEDKKERSIKDTLLSLQSAVFTEK